MPTVAPELAPTDIASVSPEQTPIVGSTPRVVPTKAPYKTPIIGSTPGVDPTKAPSKVTPKPSNISRFRLKLAETCSTNLGIKAKTCKTRADLLALGKFYDKKCKKSAF
jgi:hypothetical protein